MPSKSRKLVIIGAGELAEIALEYFTHDSEYDVVGFSVEAAYLTQNEIHGLPVEAFEELETRFPVGSVDAIVAIPASQLNALRTRLYLATKAKGYTIAKYVSSRAFVWHNATVGENSFIFEDNTIQPFTEIGNNVVMWSGNHLGHRSVIEDNCFVSSHVVISGYCRIGDSSFLGVNATLNDHIVIPPGCIIASGALVNKSPANPGRVYAGSPAAEIPRLLASKVKL